MGAIPNQNLFGVPLQPVYGSTNAPWGAPGYANVAAPGGSAASYGAGYGQSAGDSASVSSIPEADRAGLEAQALNGFLQQNTANTIRRLFHYLESNSPAYPQLNAQLPVLTLAVDAYRVGNYPQAFTLAFQVFRAIVLVQSVNREMPTLQAI
jgi:hypothetical protein